MLFSVLTPCDCASKPILVSAVAKVPEICHDVEIPAPLVLVRRACSGACPWRLPDSSAFPQQDAMIPPQSVAGVGDRAR